MRGLAIAGVLAYHLVPNVAPGGFLGVEVFFVLSGYLLTSLALEEHGRTGCIDWWRYARRRLRRIGPALGALLTVLIIVVPLVANADGYRLGGDVGWSLIGLTNWHLIHDGTSYFTSAGRPPFVRHLWSLAIEIQFYACVPVLVGWVVRRRSAIALASLAAAIALSTVWMALMRASEGASRAYYGTDTRVGALLTGVLVAVFLQRGEAARGRSASTEETAAPTRFVTATAIAGLGALVVLFVVVGDDSRFLYPLGFLACRLGAAALIVACRRPNTVTRLLEGRAPRWLGERSFGIYLWHWPLLALLRPGIDVDWSKPVTTAVVGGGAVLMGHLSFTFVERPLSAPARRDRNWHLKLHSQRWLVAAALALIFGILANLPTHDPLAQSLVAGARVVAAQTTIPASTTTAPTTTPTTVVVSTAAVATRPVSAVRTAATRRPASPSPQLNAGPPPNSYPVTAIGDSVMLGAAGAIRDRLGPSVYIDAKVSRQFAQGVQVARQMRDEGRLGDVVIVHLGTNGPPRRNDIDALMGVLDGVRRVVLVTVRVSEKWESDTNQSLADAATRFPRVVLADWYAYSEGHREWFQSDGTHLKPAGAKAFADVLAGSLPPPEPPPTTTTEPPPPTTTTTSTTTPAPAPVLFPPPTTTTTTPVG